MNQNLYEQINSFNQKVAALKKKKQSKIKDYSQTNPQLLLRLINKAKNYLKEDKTMQQVFKDYKIDISKIDLIPIYFSKKIKVSAQTDHGIIWLNFSLLADKDFFKDLGYLVHEITHYFQQTLGEKATKKTDNYLDNPDEIEGFKNQVDFITDQQGKDSAKKYVEHLVDYHDLSEAKAKKKTKQLLS